MVVNTKVELTKRIVGWIHDGRYKSGLGVLVEGPGTTSRITFAGVLKLGRGFKASRVELRRQDVNVGVLHPCHH